MSKIAAVVGVLVLLGLAAAGALVRPPLLHPAPAVTSPTAGKGRPR